MKLGLPVVLSVLAMMTVEGAASRYNRRKRDLEDAELLLKTLLEKREHGETHGEYEETPEDYDDPGPEFREGPGRYETVKSRERHPIDARENAKKKEIVLNEDEMAALIEKMAKMFSAGKASSEKRAHYAEDEDEHFSHAAHSSESHLEKTIESSGSVFNDEDVALAETLSHMKETGATAAYADIKMEPLYNSKKENEDYRAEEDKLRHTDESYLKKVDEIGKTLVKDEVYPHVSHEDFIPKTTAEAKALEGWKATHKDIFPVEETHLLKEGMVKESHHAKDLLAHGIDEKLLKELKHSLAAGEDLDEEEELLLLEKGLHKDGAAVHDELVKKAKALLGGEIGEEDHEKVFMLVKHLEKELMEKELAHKDIKTEESHAIYASKGISVEKGSIAKDIDGSEHFIGKELAAGKAHELASKELLAKERKEAHLSKEILAHGIDEELLKKIKAALAAGSGFKTEAELLLLGKQFVKGVEHGEEHKDISHLLKDFDKEKALKEGTEAYAKAKEQAHKDAQIGFGEAEIKRHIESSLTHGAEEKSVHKGFDEAELKKHIEESLAHGAREKGVHKEFDEAELKKHIEESLAHGAHGKGVHKEFDEAELKKHIEESLAHGVHKEYDEAELKKHIESSLVHGTHAIGGKDVHKTFNEEELRKHIEEHLAKEHGIAKEHGTKDLVYGSEHAAGKAHGFAAKDHHGHELAVEKGIIADGEAHHHGIHHKVEGGVDKSLRGIHEEAKKLHGFSHEVKSAAGEAKHHIGHGIAHKDEESHHGIHRKVEAGVEKSLHGIFEEGKKLHGFDHQVKTAEEEAKKHHGIAHEDDLFKKEFEEETEHHRHHIHHVLKEEEAGKHHHIEGGVESGTKKHQVSHRLRELLVELVRSMKCHLVTMRPTELLGIVNCISRKKDPLVCEKFAMCERKMPPRVIEALEECRKKITPGELKKCNRHSPLFPSRDVPLKIFQCVAIKVREVVGEERKKMIEFEKCARIVKAESCERVRWFHSRH